MGLLTDLDRLREEVAKATPAKRKSELGQFMTPSVIAEFMAAMFAPLNGKKIRLVDAGAGIGSLTAAFAERAVLDGANSLECEAWELDSKLAGPLRATLDACGLHAQSTGTRYSDSIKAADFIEAHSDLFGPSKMTCPTHAILNPPYKKISSDSRHRQALRAVGLETSNLYSAFVALALMSLEDGGELVAITPRSFCNGTYFRPFRRFMFSIAALSKIHLFESRTHAFKGDDVLQENVIFHLVKGGHQGTVELSVSDDATFRHLERRTVPFKEIVSPSDPHMVLHLAPKTVDGTIEKLMTVYNHSLVALDLAVATGPVVDFRLKPQLRPTVEDGTAPLIYAQHFEQGRVVHPKLTSKKPNGIYIDDESRRWLMPSGHYVLTRRLSSKEERRRIVPAIFDPSTVRGELIGFENHLNVFHHKKRGLEPLIAKGLAVYLGSTFADHWLRRFSGHTQVNAGDLRALSYPDLPTLREWGGGVGDFLPSQEEIDALVDGHL